MSCCPVNALNGALCIECAHLLQEALASQIFVRFLGQHVAFRVFVFLLCCSVPAFSIDLVLELLVD